MNERRAWVQNGIVTEVLSSENGFSFEDCYPAAIVAASVPCGYEVEAGWIYVNEKFMPPAQARRTQQQGNTLKSEIQRRLDYIDKRSVRAQRAILIGSDSENDLAELIALEKEAAALRDRLKSMK